jgi:multiple sugar transport system substrate-binding protein
MTPQLSRLTRRRLFVQSVGGLAAAALLAACGPNRPSSPAPAESKPAAPAATSAPAAPAGAAQPPAAPAKPAEAAKPAGETKPAAQATPGQPGTAKQTVRYHGPAGNQGDIVEMRAKELMAEKPNLDIKLELYPSTEYLQKVQTLIAGNQLGDTFWAVSSAATYHQWAAKGILLEIDEYIKRDGIKPTDYFENAWKGQLVNGKMYGLSFKGHPGASLLYFNKDLFAQAGLPEPTDDMTMDQLLDTAKKLTSGDTYGYLVPLNHAQHPTFMARLFGTQIISDDGTKAQFNGPKMLQAIQWDYDNVFTRKISPTRDLVPQPPQNPADFFVGGKAAMFKTGTWDLSIGKRIKDKFKWSAVLFPRGPEGNRGAMFSQDYIVINKNSKAPDAAWELVKGFCDKRTGILLGLGGTPDNGNSGTAGGRPDVYESEELRNNPDYTPDVHEARNRSLKETTAFNYPKNYRMNEIVTAYVNAMDQIWSGQQPTKQWADGINEQMQAIVDKPL